MKTFLVFATLFGLAALPMSLQAQEGEDAAAMVKKLSRS